MSSDNRNKVLLGFGALVVVLIIAIALWPPNFRKEEATGAVGAVQKHRAPQITQKDVILGNEKTRHEQKVLYADFLTDSAKLQSISAELRSAQAASRSVAVSAELANLSNELLSRYTAEFTEALAEASEMASRSMARDQLKAEIAELSSFLSSRKQLSDADMQQLNGKLSHLVEEMNARKMSRVVADVDTQLAGVAAELASAKMESSIYLSSSKKLEETVQELAEAEALNRISLADEVGYLAQIEMESRAIAAAEAELASRKMGDQEVASRLLSSAQELESRAMKNIEANFLFEQEMASKLRDIDGQIAAANRAVASRAAMESRATEALSRNLGAVSQALARVENAFRARATASFTAELAAIDTYLASRPQLGVAELQSELLAMEKQLESNTPLAAALANEQQLANEARELASRAAQQLSARSQ